jgi:uncharacterized membrane protein YhaH (DUF805 family)
MDWMLMPLRRYAQFDGRSCRTEYWMFVLFTTLVVLALLALGVLIGVMVGPGENGEPSTALLAYVGIALIGFLGFFFIPSIAVVVRRLHDQDKSGWMYLLSFIPYIGSIVIFVFMCLPGTKGPNQYGDDPLGEQNLGEVFR